MAPNPVKFENPPVNEVAFSVLFTSPARHRLNSTLPGLYWLEIRDEFPNIQDAAPVPPVVEPAVPGPVQPTMQILALPDMRRSWFLNGTSDRLIQIQQDRFMFNWRKVPGGSPYPSYDVLIKEFESRLKQFIVFVQRVFSMEPVFRQFELVYINHITEENGLKVVGKTQLLVDHIPDGSKNRFLPEPQAFKWETSYAFPNQWGRLHLSAGTAIMPPNSESILAIALTARGIAPNLKDGGIRDWFDYAHEWITQGFADMTPQSLHELVWKRIS